MVARDAFVIRRAAPPGKLSVKMAIVRGAHCIIDHCQTGRPVDMSAMIDKK